MTTAAACRCTRIPEVLSAKILRGRHIDALAAPPVANPDASKVLSCWVLVTAAIPAGHQLKSGRDSDQMR